jgi:hypothetical protein
VPLSTVSPVVITKYFTGAVAGKWKRAVCLVPCTVSALVFSLCQQSRLVHGGHQVRSRFAGSLTVNLGAGRGVEPPRPEGRRILRVSPEDL